MTGQKSPWTGGGQGKPLDTGGLGFDEWLRQNNSEGPGGLSGRNDQPGGFHGQGMMPNGPLASTGMGMQRPSNPMPSMMPSAPRQLPWAPPAVRAGANGTEQFTNGSWNPYTTAANTNPNQNTGITGGMNKSYQPQIRSGNTGGGGSFGMGG